MLFRQIVIVWATPSLTFFVDMTTPTPFSCPAVALRVFGISIVCALLFLLDRIIPPLLGLEYSCIQSATLYLWLIVLPLVG